MLLDLHVHLQHIEEFHRTYEQSSLACTEQKVRLANIVLLKRFLQYRIGCSQCFRIHHLADCTVPWSMFDEAHVARDQLLQSIESISSTGICPFWIQ
jgi:hypothetical protein